jgi:phosphatidylglycerophosphate synthase
MFFGISLLERLLRVVQRLGFREAIILSNLPDEVAAHLAKPSWARAEVALSFRPRHAGAVRVSDVATGADRILVVSAGFYYDARLLKTMAEQDSTALLVDSAPPPECVELWKNWRAGASPAKSEASGALALQTTPPAAALIDRTWLSRQDHTAALMDQLSSDAATRGIEACDAARQPAYVTSLRKQVRPIFFPTPPAELLSVAERFPRFAAQPAVQAFVERLNAPIEDWIVGRLCRTGITPNQVTFVTMLIGLAVTASFGTGHLWTGVALAYLVEVLDGVDGKLARTKVETTASGEWEHVIDYCIELSWWTALAFHFHAEELHHAHWLLLLLVGSDLVDRLAKRAVKKKVGRNLDDVANFDRFVRCIGGRRCINIWILAVGLILGDPANAFVLTCGWMAATAAAHVVRAWQIRSEVSVTLL